MKRYGNYTDNRFPLAAWVWGHRFRAGQHWLEYMLEFLNVLVGFNYKLGQGIADNNGTLQKYTRYPRLALRHFVFYDKHEKTQHETDDKIHKELWETLRQTTLKNVKDEQSLTLAKSLLHSFSAIEESRSWYAKSLFPAHENLLFWEGLRKGATKSSAGESEFAIDARNFFARGGEIYYLILSAATRDNPTQQNRITQALQNLLQNHNQAVGNLAQLIEDVSADLDIKKAENSEGELGWIPDPDCPLYKIIAADLTQFLQATLDPLESLYLLAHLIDFHLTLYIYFRAHPQALTGTLPLEQFNQTCKPTLLIDALDGTDSGIIRRISAMTFRQQEQQQLQAGKLYVEQTINNKATDFTSSNSNRLEPYDFIAYLKHYFAINRLGKAKQNVFEQKTDDLNEQYQNNNLSTDTFLASLNTIIFNILKDDFRKHFLGVHRKLSKAIGFVAPRKGAHARFVLEDNLLKTLVLTTVNPKQPITYDNFLKQLYQRYGLIIGPIQAQESGLLQQQRINIAYYNRNKEALLLKMKQAGLAIAYSDATAMVSP